MIVMIEFLTSTNIPLWVVLINTSICFIAGFLNGRRW